MPDMTTPDESDGHVAEQPRGDTSRFRHVARLIRSGTGSPTAALIVFGVMVAWLILGALTSYPRWWALLVTAGVPFVTLLMVVLLQHTQNHDDRATQLKLDELIRATHTATNRMMTVEDASRAHLDRIHDDFQAQAESAKPTAPGSA